MAPGSGQGVILCNGEFPRKEYPLYLLKSADVIVCCDGSRNVQRLERLGLEPTVIVGDMDSTPRAVKEKYADRLVRVEEQDDNDIAKAIPADAPVVFKANVKSLSEKAALKDNKQLQADLQKGMEGMSEALKKKMKAVMDDPKESGFALQKPVFIAVTDPDKSQFVISLGVNDKDKVTELFKSTKDDCKTMKITEGEDQTVVEDQGMQVAYNSDLCVITVERTDAATLLKQDDDKSIISQDKYAKMLEGTVRGTGIHACGFIICRDPISDWVPVSTADDPDFKDTKTNCTQYDGHVIESTGLIKMDFLGLKTLSELKEAVAFMSGERCMTISAYITSLIVDDVLAHKGVLPDGFGQ